MPTRRGETVALVIDPTTAKPLSATGAWVKVSTFWVRRQRAGEVELRESAPALPTMADDGRHLLALGEAEHTGGDESPEQPARRTRRQKGDDQ
ncbi:MAG: DUF2635 domain-containing protein [Polyangiaceae bacterium]|nr:DUF2635 domain-containing protein [Polyangiaceae bacterium]